MTEPNEYNISTMEDVLALTKEQRKRMVIDMLAWCDLCDLMTALPYLKGVVEVGSSFTWVDDERIGEISGVNITIKSEGN